MEGGLGEPGDVLVMGSDSGRRYNFCKFQPHHGRQMHLLWWREEVNINYEYIRLLRCWYLVRSCSGVPNVSLIRGRGLSEWYCSCRCGVFINSSDNDARKAVSTCSCQP